MLDTVYQRVCQVTVISGLVFLLGVKYTLSNPLLFYLTIQTKTFQNDLGPVHTTIRVDKD